MSPQGDKASKDDRGVSFKASKDDRGVSFSFSKQTNLLAEFQPGPLDCVYPIKSTVSAMIGVRYGSELIGYEYEPETDTWQYRWRETLFNQHSGSTGYPLWVTDVLGTGNDVVMLRHRTGLRFYRPQATPPALLLLAEDGRFPDVYGWSNPNHTLLSGRFYPDPGLVGVMTRDQYGAVQFYAVMKDGVLANQPNPLHLLKRNLSLTSTWTSSLTNFSLADVQRHGQDSIVLRTTAGLEIYQFKSDYTLDRVTNTSQMAHPVQGRSTQEQIFFSDLSHQSYQDILHFNDSGLFVYQYNSSQQDYTLLNYHAGFSRHYGWQPEYSDSIKLVDLNADSRDDLLFTGVKGLTVLTFNMATLNWKSLLDPEHLNGWQRYAKVISVMAANPPITVDPLAFFQDTRQGLHWARVLENTHTLMKTVQESETSTSLVNLAAGSVLQQPVRGNALIPHQIARASILEKPTLRWVEQWEDSFLKDAVDIASGQVRFNVPLVDSGLGIQLSLSYHSQSAAAGVLGVGWSLSLAQDFITVEHQGSIYPEDVRYYLSSSAGLQQLELLSASGDESRFQSPEQPDVIYCYHLGAQRWTIENGKEKATYGRASHPAAADALQWGLEWQNWRGAGRDKANQQRSVIAWYLNARHAKHNQQVLYYHYDTDNASIPGGKTYTAALRLTTISDGQQTRLDLDYRPKTAAEYKAPEPIDTQVNIVFPVPLAHKHYLQGYSITTAGYCQTMHFIYKVENQQRLLTGIQQPIASQNESVLQFAYSRLEGVSILTECTLPRGLVVRFSFDTYDPMPLPVHSNIVRYPVRERPMLAYGANYTVMGYNDRNAAGSVILRVLNREATIIIAELATRTGLPTPLQENRIQSFNLLPCDDSFMVILETDKQNEMCIFQRHNQTWSQVPSRHVFSKESLMGLSATMIAIAEPSKSGITIFECLAEKSIWIKTAVNTPPTSRLAMDMRLIVGYHNQQLWLCYRDVKHHWQPFKILDPNLVAKDGETLRRFDLAPEVQKQLLARCQQNGLLIYKNFIVWSTLQLHGTNLSTHVHLFLLDARYSITHTQEYEILRENINTISHHQEMDGSIFQLGYVQEGEFFKVKIEKFISGDIVRRVEAIGSNTNKRDDEREKLLKELNESSGWKKFFKLSWLIRWDSLHRLHASPQGVHCGNDTLLRMTGTGWERESIPAAQPIRLGQHFILEPTNDNARLMKLYRQDSSQRKQGQSLQDLSLDTVSYLCNRYPKYLAYQSTSNTTVLITFKDQQTLGPVHIFSNEQLLPQSSFRGLMTVANASTTTMVHAEAQELVVRPLSRFMPRQQQVVVNKLTSMAWDVQRLTGYQRSSSSDQSTFVYSETISVVPAANKSVSGWQEETCSYHLNSRSVTKTSKVFDASGQPVPLLPESQVPDDVPTNASAIEAAASGSMLWDRSGEWLISNFYPLSLNEDVVAYYGFESYETNECVSPSNTTQADCAWRFLDTNVVKQGFAFTGENYLHLNSSLEGNPPGLERIFQPRDQKATYVASCWLRCRDPLQLNKPVPYFRAILSTSAGHEIVGFQAQVKRQLGEWFYLELLIDFSVVKQIYEEYLVHTVKVANSNGSYPDSTLPPLESAIFRLALCVSADLHQSVDLDHIRFSPITHDFQATLYQPLTGKPTAVIRASGLVTRTLYDHVQREIATFEEDGQLVQVISASSTGSLLPSPQGDIANQPPSRLKFKPESGFHETFDEFAWRSHWTVTSLDAWKIAPGQLWHHQNERHRIEADPNLFDAPSAALRCTFSLRAAQSALQWLWPGTTLRLARQIGNFSTLSLSSTEHLVVSPLPVSGELIVMVEQTRLALWVDGVLLIDRGLPLQKGMDDRVAPWTSFAFEAEGQVLVKDCLFMNSPRLQVEYYNAWGEITQDIHLESEETVLVTENLYDQLGRAAIKTKTTRITRNSRQPLLAYYSDFVRQVNPANKLSVWATGHLHGEVDRLNPADIGVAYVRTEYDRSPLNERRVLGLPGPNFSITGHYAKRFSQHSEIAFLRNHFPASQGFRQQIEKSPNGSQRVSIFDKRNNRVANYVRVPGYDHILSTYEYDTQQNLVKILPPLYHEKVSTSIKLDAWQPGEHHLTVEEKQWQQALGTHLHYDEDGQLIRKTTPDGGTVEYLYAQKGQRRFMVSLGSTNQTYQVIYFYHDAQDQLSRTGFLTQPLATADLSQYLGNAALPHAQDYQQFHYDDAHPDPSLRGRLKRVITYNNGTDPVVETIRFNAQQQVVAKSTLALPGEVGADLLNDLEKQYQAGQLRTLVYPVTVDGQPLRLRHRYNKQGQLSGLGTPNDPTQYASFSYHADGQLASEHHQPSAKYTFTRHYRYSSPGFLEHLSDPFLTEDVAYTEGGYGQDGYGDGMVMRTAFNASWPDCADGREFYLKEDALIDYQFSALCVRALKRNGYLTNAGQPMKQYNPGAATTVPLLCQGEIGDQLAQLVAEKQVPQYYGHRYAYGNHRELVKAKYFTDETEALIAPLQRDSFSTEITGLQPQQSHTIWQLLTSAGYVFTDQRCTDCTTAFGKRGKPFTRDAALRDNLAALSDDEVDYTTYAASIIKLSIAAIGQRRTLSLAEFESTFLHWHSLDETSSSLLRSQQQRNAQRLHQLLSRNGFLPTDTSDLLLGLDDSFRSTLGNFTTFVPDIVRVLSQHFSHALGETAFDVASYDIDANGNHRHFYTGFHRYEFDYRNATNQIQAIKINRRTSSQEQTFSMQHDTQGNVIQALHKGIQSIEYDPTSQRTTKIQLTDRRTLRFYYDAQGERVLKRVLTAEGQVSQETRYLRDENGRVLVDQQTSYLAAPLPTETVVTIYLYGPRGLLGFLRNNVFYSVITDHAGSIRLVVKRDLVVAAYDYLPYGQLMRSYGKDPQAQIAYRYTGQEFDEETGLYNYHARLYDPSIGRFYQPDPQAQYFSPYKYAGNSPVSLVDPDGEFSVLIAGLVLLGTVVGAYLGGSTANNRWDISAWDFKDKGTYFGIVGGGIAGGFLPIGFAASASAIGVGATIGLGTAGAYLSTAAANQDWNPSVWQWTRPHTFNALFQGFGTGSGLVGGVSVAHNFAGKFTGKVFGIASLGKKVFLTVSYLSAGGVMYGAGVMANGKEAAFWKWDWANPATWSALVDGFDSGLGWPQGFAEIGRGVHKQLSKNSKHLGSLAKQVTPSKLGKLMGIVKNVKHPLYKVASAVVMAYYMGSAANNDFDITRWGNEFSTYEGVLNGLFFGKDVTNMLKLARSTKSKKSDMELALIPKKQPNSWLKSLDIVLKHALEKMSTRLMEDFSSTEKKRVQSESSQSSSLIPSNTDGFKRGLLDLWRSRKSRLPEQLKRLLREHVKAAVTDSSNKVIKIQEEAIKFYEKQNEVFLDTEVDFLNCHRAAKRRKRSSPGACGIPTRRERKREISEEFLDVDDVGVSRGDDDGNGYHLIDPMRFDPNPPEGFAEHISLILQKTPTKAQTYAEFFPSFILGSLLTLQKTEAPTIYAKIERVNNKSTDTTLKTYFIHEDINGQSQLILKTFIIERNKNTIETPIKSKYSNEELDVICKAHNLKNKIIKEFVYYIDNNKSLFAKESSRALEYTSKNTNSKDDDIGFKEIKSTENKNFDYDGIYSSNIDNVKKAVEENSEYVLKIYHENKERFGFKQNIEAEFQAFLYGHLSLNLKYGYFLDVYVERIAGRGYADLLLLSRRDADINKNWGAIPIIFELKADKTSTPDDAINQITSTGYLYNLSMRTVAKEAIVVGLNSNLKTLSVEKQAIPQPEGLINKLTEKTINIATLKEELMHIYYSISTMAIKTKSSLSDSYVSRVILGEILSRQNIDGYAYTKEIGKNSMSTFVLKEEHSNKWVMLNILEKADGSKTKINDKKTLPEVVQIETLVGFDVTFNSRSKSGWSGEQTKNTAGQPVQDTGYFFEDIKQMDIQKMPPEKSKISEFNEKLLPIDVNKLFEGTDTEIQSELNKLSELPKSLINSESDFQAIIHGLCLGKNKGSRSTDPIIKVFPEANLSKAGRIDLLISQLVPNTKNRVQEKLVIMELKYTEDSKGGSDHIINEATEQLNEYVNLKSVTDRMKVTSIVLLYDKKTGEVTCNVDSLRNVEHTSVGSDNDGTITPDSIIDKIADRLSSQFFIEHPEEGGNGYSRKRPGEDGSGHPNTKKVKTIGKGSRKKRFSGLPQREKVGEITHATSQHLTVVEIINCRNGASNQDSKCDQKVHGLILATTASSGANRVQIFPIKLINNMRSIFSTIVPSNLMAAPTDTPRNTDIINTEVPRPNAALGISGEGTTSTVDAQTEFFPNKLVKTLQATLASMGETVWQQISAFSTLTWAQSEQPAEPMRQQSPLEGFDAGSTLLEACDQWLATTDINGQLLWLDLLARTYIRYKCRNHLAPKTRQAQTHNSLSTAEFNIQVFNVLDEFATAMRECGTACGMEVSTLERVIEVMWLQPAVTQAIRQQLADGRLEGIPARWCELMKKSHQCVALVSSDQQATVLLQTMRANIPHWQQRLIEQEQAWQSGLHCPTDSSTRDDTSGRANCVQKLTQAFPSSVSTQTQDNHSPLCLE